MDDNKNTDSKILEKKRKLFNRTMDIVFKKIFDGKAPPKMSITVLEALLVGVSFNLDYLESQASRKIKDLYRNLLLHEELSDEKLSEGLAGKARVIGRLTAAKQTLSGR